MFLVSPVGHFLSSNQEHRPLCWPRLLGSFGTCPELTLPPSLIHQHNLVSLIPKVSCQEPPSLLCSQDIPNG